jgi:hypothetical protein
MQKMKMVRRGRDAGEVQKLDAKEVQNLYIEEGLKRKHDAKEVQ